MTFESRSKALKGISQVGRATFFCGGGAVWSHGARETTG